MKCEKCGKEANFYYSSTVNGQHEEHCLCADCAKEAGFENAFRFEPADMLGGFLNDFFAPVRFLSPFDSFGSPLRSIMAPVTPRLYAVLPNPRREAEPLSEAETKVPADAGEDVKARREREALKAQLDEAVQAEDFERAIALRDQLRRLEG